jgi:nucleoside-diphosphate-sugar epimerase
MRAFCFSHEVFDSAAEGSRLRTSSSFRIKRAPVKYNRDVVYLVLTFWGLLPVQHRNYTMDVHTSARQRMQFLLPTSRAVLKSRTTIRSQTEYHKRRSSFSTLGTLTGANHFDSCEPLVKALRKVIDLLVSAVHPQITFVSSICAVGDWPLRHPDRPKVPERVICDRDSAMPNGYGRSKYIAEQLLAKAHEIARVRVNIVRARQISGSASSTRHTWSRQGWFYSDIKSSAKLGAFPKHLQPLDSIPVDTLAQRIANCTKRPSTPDGLQVSNIVHPRPSSWSLMHEVLRTRFGIQAEAVDLSNWLERVEQGRLRLHGFLSTQGNRREMNMSYENTRALEVLPPVRPIHADLLVTWLRGWRFLSRAKL